MTEQHKSELLVIHAPAVDFDLTPLGKGRSAKQPCSAKISVCGAGVNVARAYQRMTRHRATLAAILARDALGSLACESLGREFDGWNYIPTAEATRFSFILPNESAAGERKIYTIRAAVDCAATLAALRDEMGCHSICYIGPFAASQFDLVDQLLDEATERQVRVYLALSQEQLADRNGALALARKAAWLQINRVELQQLVGQQLDVVDSINRLREWGVRGIVVTDGPAGVVVHVDGQWAHDTGFEVRCSTDVAAGDTFSGAFLAAQAEGLDLSESVKLANAAAAAHVAGIAVSGFDEVRTFASVTPRRRRVVTLSRVTAMARQLGPAGLAATAAGIGAIGMWLIERLIVGVVA